jgi:hypothetical protein
MFFSDSESETFTLGISMFYAGASVEEAFSVQSLVSTPSLQNLIILYKISSNFNNFSDLNVSESEPKMALSETFTFPMYVKIK